MFVDLIFNEVLQRYEASYPSTGTTTVIGSSLGGGSFPSALFGDGSGSAPSIAFTSEPTLGLFRGGAAILQVSGALTVSGTITSSSGSLSVAAAQFILFAARTAFAAPAVGVLNISNSATTIGSQVKVDALPTISSGFGTSPAVTAGSTPFAGSIDVGTGGVATTGVILWNGTAFAAAPFIAVTCSLGAVPTVAVTTASQVTFTTSVAWPASTKVSWICVSSRA